MTEPRYRLPEAMRPLVGLEFPHVTSRVDAQKVAKRMLARLRRQQPEHVAFEPLRLHEHAIVPAPDFPRALPPTEPSVFMERHRS